MVNEEIILVKIINKIVGEEDLVKESNLLKTLKKDNGDIIRVYEEQTNAQRTRVSVTQGHNKIGKDTLKVEKETLAQGPRFKMHYLGIMFGGMALNRAMANLTATSKEWVGMGEIMSTTMGVVMLPATLALLNEAVLPLSEALLNLPPSIQTVIGVTVLGLGAVGKIAEIAGQIFLGAAAFNIAYGQIAKQFGPALTKAIALNIGKGILVAVALTIAWQSLKTLNEGIEAGDPNKTLRGVLGLALGVGLGALAFVGLSGAAVAFTLAIGVGLILTWSLSRSKADKTIRELAGANFDFGAQNIAMTKGSTIISNPELLRFPGSENLLEGFGGGNSSASSPGSFQFQGFGNQVAGSSTDMGNISITNNINVKDNGEVERMIQKNNSDLIRTIRSN